MAEYETESCWLTASSPTGVDGAKLRRQMRSNVGRTQGPTLAMTMLRAILAWGRSAEPAH